MTREPHPIDAILPSLTDVKTIVEIGCHRMEDTAFLRETFPKARIIAFEADPRNAKLIVVKELDWRYTVDFFELAVGDTNDVRNFWLSTNNLDGERGWTRSSSLRQPRDFGSGQLLERGVVPCVFIDKPTPVACIRLDTFFEDLGLDVPPIDLLWCDAQGAEDLIIAGAPETLKRTRYLFLEHNTDGCYEGAPDRAKLETMLPGWETMHVWPHDMLMRNRRV